MKKEQKKKLQYIKHKSFGILLIPLAFFYRAMIFWRNFFYNVGFFVSKRLPCIVVSVGNLSVGGTGKTPTVIYIASTLQNSGKRVAVLSRGYGRKSKGTVLVSNGKGEIVSWREGGDEPVLIAKKLPQIPIVSDENRIRGGQFLIEHFNPDYIILDDGFQHRAIERDLDIVLINAQSDEKNHTLLPFGMLREPINQLTRADIIFLTKTNLGNAKPSLPTNLSVAIFNSSILTQETLKGMAGEALSINEISTKKVFAVSGLGDPVSFHSTLTQIGAQLSGHFTKPDHYNYTNNDLIEIKNCAEDSGADYILTTEKDLIKLSELKASDIQIFAVPIKFQPDVDGRNQLLKMLTLN